MQKVINAEQSGIPLQIQTTVTFKTWLVQQASEVQNWLEQTDFCGEGVSIIPTSDGSIAMVIIN